MTSIIDGIKNYVAACPLLADISKRHINWLEDSPDNYGIYPSGDTVLSTYISGSEERLYTFAVEVRKMTDSDVRRLESSGFIEKLQIYFNSAPLPLLPAGCTAQELYAENAMLFDLDKSGKKGTFSVQCKMKYDIDYTEVNNT